MKRFGWHSLVVTLLVGAGILASTSIAKADGRHWGNDQHPWWGHHLYSPYIPYGYSTYGYGSPYGYSGRGLGYGGYGGVYAAPYQYGHYSTYPSYNYYGGPYPYGGQWIGGRWW